MNKKAEIIGLVTTLLPMVVQAVCFLVKRPVENDIRDAAMDKAVAKYFETKAQKG